MKNRILRLFAVLFAVLFSAFSTDKAVSEHDSVLQADYDLIHYFVSGDDFNYIGSWGGARAAIPFYYYTENSKADLGTPIIEELGVGGIGFMPERFELIHCGTQREGDLFCHEFQLMVAVQPNLNDYDLIGDFEIRFSNVRDCSFRYRLIQDKLNG